MIAINKELAEMLIKEQFPQWANEAIRPVSLQGHDNRSYRLGEDKVIRMPSNDCYVPQVEKEHRFLAELATSLPLSIPQPLAKGKPSGSYPYPWSVYHWIDGECLVESRDSGAELVEIAKQLANFLVSFQQLDAATGPTPGQHNFYRGAEFSHYGNEALSLVEQQLQSKRREQAETITQCALQSQWQKKPVWVHGDISPGNLLIRDNKLVAVIDFGCLGVGDPACDLMIAWTYFDARCRCAFKHNLSIDNQTWQRAKAWALWKCLQPTGPESQRREQILSAILEDE